MLFQGSGEPDYRSVILVMIFFYLFFLLLQGGLNRISGFNFYQHKIFAFGGFSRHSVLCPVVAAQSRHAYIL